MKSDLTVPKGALAILGNGPSLREVDLGALSDIDTLGMNAAYRHWDRIDWRPSHYACLDDALIETHAKQIRQLVEEDRIDSFFLTARILELEPDLRDHQHIFYLDQFVPHWHRVRGVGLGLEFLPARAFKTTKPNMLTTGAYATRFGAWMNYQTLILLGMDLTYHPLAEADQRDDARLEIRKTPEQNPNYFFDDYQREGDVFHVPNPPGNSSDLHFQSFECLIDDFNRENIQVRVINGSETSRLREINAISSHSLSDLLREAPLGQVLVPFTANEVDRILDNFWLWSLPGFRPSLGTHEHAKPRLIFIANNDDAFAKRQIIQDAFDHSPELQSDFSSISVINLELSGDSDRYQRDNKGKASSEGRRAGPNNLFFGAMDAAQSGLGGSLLMETDCIPIRPGWLDQAAEFLQHDRTSWVMGSIYLGDDQLAGRDKRHINGNALYATSDPAFQSYLRTDWRPGLQIAVKSRPELPFDCFFEHMMDQSDSMDTSESGRWSQIRRVQHRFRFLPFILNYAGSKPRGDALARRLSNDVHDWKEAYLVHSTYLSNAVRVLRRDRGSSPAQLSRNDLFDRLSTETGSQKPDIEKSSDRKRMSQNTQSLLRKAKQRILKPRQE
ncbi:MAG: hypothetical protein AAGF33_08105 [Pseudomonadota bacterium]